MKKLVLVACMLMLSACGSKDRTDLKSPCVGLEDSPCGDKRMVNDWWLA